ncbi:amidohydrolase family protein [Echinimonas agarilytica]|uniref:Amidohydrolase family protein n=1 Tax=Echinimonas agarilytica TaxID=1215918 RepID=A0AA41W6G3_9GAMM|nr:amidohydrolase family protein [Echinimonas agarilytica]MCM2679454.1 amidohydrolase family protein [Echinimonas agarilytica]
MRHIKTGLLAGLVAASMMPAMAATTLIKNATIYTQTAQGVLQQSSVLFENGTIVQVGDYDGSADTVIDAKGAIVTPGLIGTMNQLGLIEVDAVSSSADVGTDKANAAFDPSLAFNPKSSLIPLARKGGITRNVVAPTYSHSVIAGQLKAVNLSGELEGSVHSEPVAVVSYLGASSEDSRAVALAKLRHQLEDLQQYLTKKKTDEDAKSDLSERERVVMERVAMGELPLVIYVDRAADILQVIELKTELGVELVINSGMESWVVAEQLAAANVPVILNALAALPSNFDSLNASLHNAQRLEQAGVDVIIAESGDRNHRLYQLRFQAGHAVANGLTFEQALSAVTSTPAEVFGLTDVGQIAPGKRADLVLWSHDPLDLQGAVEKLWIDGKDASTQSRQDALRDRYMMKSDMPKAYLK